MSYVRVPPDGTGKKVYTTEHTIGSDDVQVQVIEICDPHVPTQHLHVDSHGAASIRFAEGTPNIQGFGSLKVSTGAILGTYESSCRDYEDLMTTTTTTGGTKTVVPGESSVLLTVDGTINARVTRTTNRYHHYTPGASNMAVMTIACDAGKAGNVRRWGMFDDNDGIFFELNGTTLYAVVRSSVTGTVVDTKVAEADWSSSDVEGHELSPIELDKINIWWIDAQWLGGGRVRFGTYTEDGDRLVRHVWGHAGVNTLPYMRTSTLPLRTENLNTTATGSPSQLREVCMSVWAEKENDDLVHLTYSSDIVPAVSASAPDTLIGVIKQKETIDGHHNAIQTYPHIMNIHTTAPVAVSIWKGVTIDGTETWEDFGHGTLQRSFDAVVDYTGSKRAVTLFFDTGVDSKNMCDVFRMTPDNGVLVKADGVSEVWAYTITPLTDTPVEVIINMNYRSIR